MTTHHLTLPFFTRGFLTKDNMTVDPFLPYFSLLPRLKIKLKSRHFDTIEMIKTELQAVLNTFTEHDFQDAFKTIAEALEMVHTCGRGLRQV
jgi:hypothetical protein